MRSQIVLGFLVAFIHLYTTTDAKALYVKDIINNESTALDDNFGNSKYKRAIRLIGDAVEIGLKALRILTGGAKRLPIMNGYARFFEKPGDIGTLRRDLSILPNEPRHVFRDLQGRNEDKFWHFIGSISENPDIKDDLLLEYIATYFNLSSLLKELALCNSTEEWIKVGDRVILSDRRAADGKPRLTIAKQSDVERLRGINQRLPRDEIVYTGHD